MIRNTAAEGQTNIWQDLRDYLVYESDEGRRHIAVSEAAREHLEAWMNASRRPKAKKTPPTPDAVPAVVPPEAGLEDIAHLIENCTSCSLARTRNRTVPGHGNPHPELLFVGEAPGADEDLQGLPFVGRSGALLTKMITNLGLSREEVFIANIIKCRPPANRTPTPTERETCIPYLEAQIERLRPKVIVALGATALRGLLRSEDEISRCRGVWHEFKGIPLMPTFHPSYLLRNLKARFDTWDDMLKVLERIGRRPPTAKPRKI